MQTPPEHPIFATLEWTCEEMIMATAVLMKTGSTLNANLSTSSFYVVFWVSVCCLWNFERTHLKFTSARDNVITSTVKSGKVTFRSYLLNHKWFGQKIGEIPEKNMVKYLNKFSEMFKELQIISRPMINFKQSNFLKAYTQKE